MTTIIRSPFQHLPVKKYSKILVSFVLLWVTLNGCYTPRYVYSPSAHNVPVLSAKGDSKLAVNYSSNGGGNRWRESFVQARSNGADIQGAYAFHKNWAVQSSFFTRNERNGGDYSNTDSAVIRYKRRLVDAGIGYYKSLHPKGDVYFQVFAGMGAGKFSFTDNGRDDANTIYSRFHEANIIRFYIQPALQVQYRKLIAASFSSRFSFTDFRNIQTNYASVELENYALQTLGDGAVVFWEPAFINSFGTKKIPGLQLEYQLGFSMLMSRRFIDARTFNFSIGLQSDLGILLKKKGSPSKK